MTLAYSFRHQRQQITTINVIITGIAAVNRASSIWQSLMGNSGNIYVRLYRLISSKWNKTKKKHLMFLFFILFLSFTILLWTFNGCALAAVHKSLTTRTEGGGNWKWSLKHNWNNNNNNISAMRNRHNVTVYKYISAWRIESRPQIACTTLRRLVGDYKLLDVVKAGLC